MLRTLLFGAGSAGLAAGTELEARRNLQQPGHTHCDVNDLEGRGIPAEQFCEVIGAGDADSAPDESADDHQQTRDAAYRTTFGSSHSSPLWF